jgi:hypothetical protein
MQLLNTYTFSLRPPLRRPLCTSLQKGSGGIVAFAIKALTDSLVHGNVSFFQIEVPTGTVQHSSTSSLLSGRINNVQLYYDLFEKDWIIAAEGGESLGVYKVSPTGINQPWEQLRLVESKKVGFGNKTLVAFWQQEQQYPLVFYVTDVGEVSDSRLYWTQWKSNNQGMQSPFHLLGYCDTVVPFLTEEGCLLFLCQRLFQQLFGKTALRRGPGDWSITVAAYRSDGTLMHQTALSEISFPIRNIQLPEEDFFAWLRVSMSVTVGPKAGLDDSQTCVAALMLSDTQSNLAGQTSKGGLYWIDAQGHVIGQERNLPGEHICLCLCGEEVIGTDLFEGRYRIWRWSPLAGTERQVEAYLSPRVIRATIAAAEDYDSKELSESFWCIEEYLEGVNVSLWASKPIQKLEKIWIEGITLLDEVTASYTRERKPKGIVAYHDILLFLGIDKEQQLKLLHIQRNRVSDKQ